MVYLSITTAACAESGHTGFSTERNPQIMLWTDNALLTGMSFNTARRDMHVYDDTTVYMSGQLCTLVQQLKLITKRSATRSLVVFKHKKVT